MRLAAWVDRRRGQPFRWGELDCALLAFEALDAMADSGAALADAYRGGWASRAEARRFQRERGIRGQQALAAAGCVLAPIGRQQRGDILAVPRWGFDCLYVCTGWRALGAHPLLGVHWAETDVLLGQPGVAVWRLGS